MNQRWRAMDACGGLHYTAIETTASRRGTIQIPLYKIELIDERECTPVFAASSGTTCTFCENIENFQERWLRLERFDDRKERFFRSKGGEVVTDRPGDSPEHNIVQYDLATIYAEKTIVLHGATFEVTEFFCSKELFYVERLELWFRWISFKGNFWRIVSLVADGACFGVFNNVFLERGLYEVEGHRNSVLENRLRYRASRDMRSRLEDFAPNRLISIGFLETGRFFGKAAMEKDICKFTVTEGLVDELFRNTL